VCGWSLEEAGRFAGEARTRMEGHIRCSLALTMLKFILALFVISASQLFS
jgi:hypothetical protein